MQAVTSPPTYGARQAAAAAAAAGKGRGKGVTVEVGVGGRIATSATVMQGRA